MECFRARLRHRGDVSSLVAADLKRAFARESDLVLLFHLIDLGLLLLHDVWQL